MESLQTGSGIQPRVGGGGVGQTPAVTICQSWELQSEYISILQSLSILTARTNHIMILMILEENNLSNTFIVMTLDYSQYYTLRCPGLM